MPPFVTQCLMSHHLLIGISSCNNNLQTNTSPVLWYISTTQFPSKYKFSTYAYSEFGEFNLIYSDLCHVKAAPVQAINAH
jgi:hypothetical protein